MTPDQIEWCEPPNTGPGRVAEFVEILKSRPGEWAKYPFQLARSSLHNTARSNTRRYPGTEWRGCNRDLYGRWVGTD